MACIAARKRGNALRQTLLLGPSGTGKTTLAYLMANEMGGKLLELPAPTIKKEKSLIQSLRTLGPNGILFIDEAHRLKESMQDWLLTVLESGKIQFEVATSSREEQLPPFTMMCATTHASSLELAFRERFGLIITLQYYPKEVLGVMLWKYLEKNGFEYEIKAMADIANRSRGIPRLAMRFSDGCMDLATYHGTTKITGEISREYFTVHNIVDKWGLTVNDRKLLTALSVADKPIALDNLAAVISERKENLLELYEPFLLEQQLMVRTGSGRMATAKALDILKQPVY
jgi:Holliday junction DNA helicase RuvB